MDVVTNTPRGHEAFDLFLMSAHTVRFNLPREVLLNFDITYE